LRAGPDYWRDTRRPRVIYITTEFLARVGPTTGAGGPSRVTTMAPETCPGHVRTVL